MRRISRENVDTAIKNIREALNFNQWRKHMSSN